MRVEITFLHSKLARRIFWLFVLCALLPITLLALISLRNVSTQLREESTRELHLASREAAMGTYERLSLVEANIRLIKLSLRPGLATKSSASDLGISKKVLSGLQNRLDGLQITTLEGKRQDILGHINPVISFTSAENQFLTSGKSIVSTADCGRPEPCILMSQSLGEFGLGDGIIVGEIKPSYLWDPEMLSQNLVLSVFDASEIQLFSSDGIPEQLPQEATAHFSGQFEWDRKGQQYLASYWKMPLQNAFSTSHWTVVMSKTTPDMLAPLKKFRTGFLLVFLLATWTVLLLSLVQIRRNLVPLGKLKEGTQAVSVGNFQTRVNIKSGDEFEDLAASFNFMAGRIERQLNALKSMSEIDRAILSAWDLKRIIGTVCVRLRDLVPYELLCVHLMDSGSSGLAHTEIFAPGSDTPTHSVQTEMTRVEFVELTSHPNTAVQYEGDGDPSYLSYLKAMGMRHFLIVPVVLEKGSSAIFILGQGSKYRWTEEIKDLAGHHADQIAVAFTNAHLLQELQQLQWGTLTALARAIDAKSPWTLGHSERVTACAIRIAQAMGLPPRELDIMRRGGLVHDIGKIGTPAEILDKPGKLTDDEMKTMREHVNTSVRILQPISALAESMPIVSQHHEWINGGGYPNGLIGDQISLHARIFAVADCFDALISDRPYRKGLPITKVMQILRDGAGKQFDPRVLDIFQTITTQENEVELAAEVVERVG